MEFYQINKSLHNKTNLQETKYNQANGRRYLQIIYPTEGLIFNKELIQFNKTKKQTTALKIEQRSKNTFFQKEHKNDQKTHEKMFKITNF